MAPLSKSAPKYSKRLIPDDNVVATAISVNGATVSGGSLGNLVAGSLNSYTITDSTIDSTTIGFSAAAAAIFTQLTVGAPTTPGDVTFWGTPSSYAKWVAASGQWHINSNGNPNGGLLVDNLMLQNNTLSTTSGPLILNPTTNVVMSPETRIKFDSSDNDSGTSIFGSAAGGLQLTSSACINLRPTIAVTIPSGIPLWFDGTCSSPVAPIYRSGLYNDPQSGQMLMGGQGGIALSTNPGTSIALSTPNTPLVFGPLGSTKSPIIQGDSVNGVLNMTASTAIDMNVPQVVLASNGHLAWNPNFSTNYITGGNGVNNSSGITIAGGDDDVKMQSNQNLVLGPAQNVVIPGTEHLVFPQVDASIGADSRGTNFVVRTSSPRSSIVLEAGSGVIAVPKDQVIQFGSPLSTNQTIGSGGQSILNITAPQINLNGNVIVTGSQTTLKTEQLTAADPIVQLGLDLPAGNIQDRGWMAQYAERTDPLSAFTFMGWQPVISAFALLSQTHDDGTGHYVPGSFGDLQMGNLTVTNTVTARSGALQLGGSSVSVGDGIPLYIGSGGAGFISDSRAAAGNVLTVLQNQLQFGNSLIQGGSSQDAALVLQNQSGGLNISSGRLQLGDLGFSPFFSTRSPSTNLLGTTTYLQNSTIFQVPNQTLFQWGNNDIPGIFSTITGDSTQGTVNINASQTLVVNAPSITGQVAWQAATVGLQYGGTGRSGFTIDGAVPFVDLHATVLNESNQFRFLSSSQTLVLGSTQIQPQNLLLSSSSTIFTVPQGTLQLGTSASMASSSNAAALLNVYGDVNIRNALFLGPDNSRSLSTSAVNIVGTSDVVLAGSSLVLASNTLVASTTATPLQIRSPLVLDSDKHIVWEGSSSAEIIGLNATSQLFLNATGGISVPSSYGRAFTWNGGFTSGETIAVGFYRTANSLNYMGSSIDLNASSSLQFGLPGNATAFNSIQSDGFGGLNLQSPQNIRLSAPQVVIDADLRVLGTTIETVSRTTVLNENIFQIGQGQTLNIVAVTPYSGSSNQLLVQTQSVNQLQAGQNVQITNVDTVPDVEGKYQVVSAISSTQFIITSNIQLTQNGTRGSVLAPLTTDPAVDVGFQLGYYNGAPMNAFLVWQHSTQSFTLYKNATLSNGIVTDGVAAPLLIGSLQTSFISGFTLLGPLTANNQVVSGSSFAITGGSLTNVSLDQWSTSTSTVITNLNSDRVRGLTITDFVLRDGSQALTHDWYAGSYLITSGTLAALNCTNSVYLNKGISATTTSTSSPATYLDGPVLAKADTGVLYTDYAYYGYDSTSHTLIASIDVSSPQNDIYFRDQQIPGNKIGPGLANCDITGNAATVTNGVYRTDYLLSNSVLVSSNGTNNPQPISLPSATVLGTDPNGVTQALNGTQLNDIIGPYLTYERITANLDPSLAPILDTTKSLSKICPDPNSLPTSSQVQISYVELPNGIREAQTHQLKGHQISTGLTSIAIRLWYIAPEDQSTPQWTWIYLSNNGQSIELLWDNDIMGWYHRSAGVDIFLCQ